jgi:hypothetical protein
MFGISLRTFAFWSHKREIRAAPNTLAFSLFTMLVPAINGKQMIRAEAVQS